MGLLDIYNNGGTQLNQIYNDLSTNYPQTNTGVPTNTQNPGGPVQNFNQEYNENNTYVNNIGTGVLDNTLPITNFDVENPSVQGGPASSTTDPTSYSPYISGVPTNTQNPGGPVKKFNQTYTPNNKYITSNSPGNVNSGQLQNKLTPIVQKTIQAERGRTAVRGEAVVNRTVARKVKAAEKKIMGGK